MLSNTEENYLKAIFNIHQKKADDRLGTNELADYLEITPATVTNMLKKLRSKDLISYKKYGSISLTSEGSKIANSIVRKHRLWETFLYEKMDFTWDEVHEVAEQLEHIQSTKLVDQLDKLLGNPEVDPHGDPIPKATGEIKPVNKMTLAEVKLGEEYTIVAVKDSSAKFLQYATSLGIGLDRKVKVLEYREFDGSMDIQIGNSLKSVSGKFAENVFVI